MSTPSAQLSRTARRRVLLADDHPIVRQAVKSMLSSEGYEIIAEASDGREAVQQCIHHRPEIAVLDHGMPLLTGIEAAREIAKFSPNTKVVVLSVRTEDQIVVESLRAGARAYVSKGNTATELLHAIQAVCRGETYLDSRLPQELLLACRSGGNPDRELLAPRERQVLRLIAEGRSLKQIALVMGISHKTVQSHRANLMNKLGIRDTAGLVRYAVRTGLTEP